MNKKILRKGKIETGTIFVIVILTVLMCIAYTIVGGTLPAKLPVPSNTIVVVTPPKNEPAQDNLQLHTFYGATITPITSSSVTLPSTQPPSSNSIPNIPSVKGTQIIDNNGNTLLLRGAMLEGPFAYISSWQKAFPSSKIATIYGDHTFAAMQTWKMNVVRINISQWMWQNTLHLPYSASQYINAVDTAITSANNHGLYVVLDFHDDLKSGAVSPYNDDMLHQISLQWWTILANRYKNNPTIFFDLINEPKYPDWCSWAYGGNGTKYGCRSSITNPDVAGFIDVTNAIRNTGAKNIIVLEPGKASKDGGWNGITPSIITDQNSIVSKHEYGAIIQDSLTSLPQVAWKSAWGPMLGIRPLYYGEWAVLSNPQAKATVKCNGLTSSNANSIVMTFLQYMDSVHASWTAWEFGVDHLIRDTTSFTPTNFSDGATWQCPDATGNPPAVAAHDGMGTVLKNYLSL